jgi:hypothetical protein
LGGAGTGVTWTAGVVTAGGPTIFGGILTGAEPGLDTGGGATAGAGGGGGGAGLGAAGGGATGAKAAGAGLGAAGGGGGAGLGGAAGEAVGAAAAADGACGTARTTAAKPATMKLDRRILKE